MQDRHLGLLSPGPPLLVLKKTHQVRLLQMPQQVALSSAAELDFGAKLY